MALRRGRLALPHPAQLRARVAARMAATEEEPFQPRTRRVLPPVDARDMVPWPLRVSAAWSWRLIVVGFAVYAGLMLAARLTLIAYSLLISLLLAALLAPAVAALRRLGLGRAPSAALVFVAGIAAVSGIFYVLGTALVEELPDIGEQASDGVEQIRSWLINGPFGLQQSDLDNYLQQGQIWFDTNRAVLTTGALGAASAVGEFLAGLALTLFATFFFLYDGGRIWAFVVRLLPTAAEEPAFGAGNHAWATLGGYVRGVVLVAAIDGIGIGIILTIVGVPLAVPLAILVFFGAFVPLVGAFLTGAVAVLVALVTEGPVASLVVLAGIVAVQQLEGNVLQPLIMSRFVRLHPLAVALAVTAGGLLAGIGGAIIAVPVVAVINVAVRYLNGWQHGEEPPVPGEEPDDDSGGTDDDSVDGPRGDSRGNRDAVGGRPPGGAPAGGDGAALPAGGSR